MTFTDKEVKGYMAGKLRLHTTKDGSRLIPKPPRKGDLGITTPKRRAYWRVWYLKNRAKQMAASRVRYGLLKHGVATKNPRPRLNLDAAGRLARRKAQVKVANQKYQAKLRERKAAIKPKKTWTERLFGWF
jgi:hypothetical protein